MSTESPWSLPGRGTSGTKETLTAYNPLVSRRFVLLALLVAAIVPYFVGLGDSSIWDANEAFYVETPREMMERGDYVFPTFNYEPRLNKPVLSYWIVAAFYQLIGVSPGVQRIPIALGGLVLIVTAFALAWLAWPDGHRADAQAIDAALWAALGLAASPRLLLFARRIFIDIYISVFMALTLLCFALAERHPSHRRLFLTLMYAAVGLATLTKGPMAIVLPGLVFLLYLLAHGELRRVREMLFVPGVLLVGVIVAPWYVALYQRDGWTHIASFVFGENLARFTDGVGVNAERGPLFYIPVVFSDAFPWSLLLPVAAVWWVVDRRGEHGLGSPARRVQSLLWLWILVTVVFFSMSEAKQDLYIFPIVPAVAALGGVVIARASSETLRLRARGLVQWASSLAGFVLLVLGAGVTYLFQGPDPVGAASAASLSGVPVLGAIMICGGAAALIAALAGRATAALIVTACALVAANWLIVVRVLPDFEAYKPVPGLSRVLTQRATPDDVIATYNVAVPSLVYYLRRHIEMSYDATPIVELLSSDRRAFVILPSRDYEAVRDRARAHLCVLSTHATFDVKLRNVLARDPLPELWLITNRCGEGGQAP